MMIDVSADRDEALRLLAQIVGCIASSARDDGPPITRGSEMARVCQVLMRTTQIDAARRFLDARRDA